MTDTREAVLERIAAIATQQAGFKSAVRNRGLRDNEKRPAIVILDGDETPVLTHGGRQNRAQSGRAYFFAPSVVAMKPEIYVLMDEQAQTLQRNDIGPALNAKRVQLVEVISQDDQLKALLGSNGVMIYQGCSTDLKSGGALSGQMRIDIQFNYVFFPKANTQGVS
jgi:hypothetical protein